ALVPKEQRLTIGSCNYRLSTAFKPKEPTFQVALDVVSLTYFYPAFLVTASAPTVYMQEFWAIVSYQKHHIRFKMNKKSYSFNLDTFRNMLQTDSDNNGDDFVHPKFLTHDDEARHEEEDNDDDSHGMNVEGDELDDEGENEEDDGNELYRDVNINLEGRQQSSSVSSRFVSNMLNPSPDTGIDSIFNLNIESTPWVDVPVTITAKPPLLSATTLPLPSTSIIPHRLGDEAQAENEDFLNKLDENIQKIIKEQVKEQVKAQVSKILPKIEKTVNEQLEAKVLTRSSNSSKISHAVAANLFELELKKILINKMESNKSIHRFDEQKNLYKALVDAYECDKLVLDTYRDTVTLKRRRDDEDKDEELSVRSNRGSKRSRAGKEQESISAPKEKTSKTTGKLTEGSKSHHKSASESAQAEEPMPTTKYLEEPTHQEFETVFEYILRFKFGFSLDGQD
nr:hypothetical protein [Tanacetum cinerariifolium]